MVYGKILFNNIKEYTPKWYATIPYSQTIKPVFGNSVRLCIGRKPQVVWSFNSSPAGKTFWKNFAFVFQRHSFMWQILLVGIAFVTLHICRDPFLMLYEANNVNRTYKAAITK